MVISRIPKNLINLPFLREFLKGFRGEIALELDSISSSVGTDAHAATIVVDKSGNGDADTIAGGIALLPAAGGELYIRQGTYAITSPIVLPDKPIVITGTGSGGAQSAGGTIIDLASNAIFAFTQANSDRHIAFQHLQIKGAGVVGVAGQGFLEYTGGTQNETNLITCRDLWINGVMIAFENNGTGEFSPRCTDCRVLISSSASGRLYDAGGSVGGTIRLLNTECEGDGAITGTNARLEAVNSELSNGSATATTLDNIRVVGGQLSMLSGITVSISDNIISGCNIISDTLTFAGGSNRNVISGCRFVTPGVASSLSFLASSNNNVVSGCEFEAFMTQAILIASINNVVVGNENCLVTETGSANTNRYGDNSGFAGSTIIGADSIVNGSKKAEASAGVTTGSFVSQFTAHTNTKGLVGIGTVKNIGAMEMEVRESVTDAFGTSVTVDTAITAGNDYLLDPQTNFSTARPPYVSYEVLVRHTGVGEAPQTTFDLQFTGRGIE